MEDRDKLFEEISSRRFPEIVKFRHVLTPESDRGCALLAASYLDGELEALLRARLVDDAKTIETFFRPDGPLGSFSARIDMAYLLGLIGSAARRDLDLIREIRNDFGHNPSPIDFSHPAIANRCRELSHSNLESNAKPRSKYMNSVLGIAAVIHVECHIAEHQKLASDTYPPSDEMKAQSRKVATAVVEDIIGKAMSKMKSQRSHRAGANRQPRKRR